jgi:hypothetical protein
MIRVAPEVNQLSAKISLFSRGLARINRWPRGAEPRSHR